MEKHLKLFNTILQYNEFKNDIEKYILPNVVVCEEESDELIFYNDFISIKNAYIICDQLTYNEEQQYATNIIVSLNGDILRNNIDYIVSEDNGGTNVGNYIFTLRGIGNYKDEKNGKFTINKVTPTVVAPTAKTLTYNGSNQQLVNAGSTDWGTLKYSLDNSTWSTNIPTTINVGSYTVYYKVEGDSNINDIESTSIQCYISEKLSNISIELSEDVYTYDGTAKEPTIIVKDGSTIISSSEYTVSYSNNINAGAGTVTITDNIGGNYYIEGSTTFTINKVTPTVVAPTAKTLTYNGSNQQLVNAGSTNFGTLKYSLDNSNWSTNIPVGTNVGSYTVYYKVEGNSNINDIASTLIECSINVKQPNITIELSQDTYTYNGNTKEPIVTIKDGSTIISSEEYTVSYSNNINAGTATITISDNTGGNYIVNGSTTFTINKVTPTVISPVPNVLTFNKSAQELAINGSTNWGTLKYSLDNSTWSTSMPTAINGGSYTLYYKVDGDSNINNISSNSILCSIAEKRVTNPTIILSQNLYTYNGSSINPTPTVKDGDDIINPIEYTVSYLNNINAGTGTVIISDVVNGDYYIEGTQTFTINKVTPTVVAPTSKTLTYNGSNQQLINTGSTDWGTLKYSLDNSTWSTDIPVGTNVGSYTVYYKVEGDNNINNVESASIECLINKVTPVIIAPTTADLAYNGYSQQLVNAGSTDWGTLKYSLDNSNWSTNIPTAINAGSYTVYYKVEGNNNINDITSTYITCIIEHSIITTYNATSTSSPTQILNSFFSIASIRIDGVKQQNVITSYTFDTLGEHIIIFTLKPNYSSQISNIIFSGCTNLTSITIPNSVTSIEGGAFMNCSGLTSITISDSVISIGDGTFANCSGLTSITLGSGLTSIGNYAFRECSSLTSITIPDSVTSIGYEVFNSCFGLTSITLGSGLTSISDKAFYCCSGLTSITIPNSVTSIGQYAFYSSGLTSITLGSGLTSIGNYAFLNCSSLTSITIPDSVTSISQYAFYGCSRLTSITLGSGLTSIGNYVFFNCSGLTSITCNATTAPTIQSDTFHNVKTGGTLTVPAGSTGYNVWMGTGSNYLGYYNWTKVEQ